MAIINAWIADNEARPVQAYTFIITHRQTAEFVGMIGVRIGRPAYRIAEVWYKLHVSQWGRGYATEALRRIIEFGFVDLTLHRMEAGCATANTGSVRVLEKAGMKREGMRRKALPLKSGWADNYIYGILYDE